MKEIPSEWDMCLIKENSSATKIWISSSLRARTRAFRFREYYLKAAGLRIHCNQVRFATRDCLIIYNSRLFPTYIWRLIVLFFAPGTAAKFIKFHEQKIKCRILHKCISLHHAALLTFWLSGNFLVKSFPQFPYIYLNARNPLSHRI